MISDFIDLILDLIKGLFTFVFDIASAAIALIFKDFLPIVLGLVALGLIWYVFGGYDRAEQAYRAGQKKSDEQAQVLQQLEAQKAKNPNAGVYIVK